MVVCDDAKTAHFVNQLRQELHSLFLRRMKAFTKPCSEVDEAALKAVVSVLTAEDQRLGLQQPPEIGQCPLSLTIHYNQTVAPTVARAFFEAWVCRFGVLLRVTTD